MEFRDYYEILRERWLSVALALAMGVAISGIMTLATTPTYQSTSRVFVSVSSQDSTSSTLLQGSNFTQGRVESYASLVRTPLILTPVIDMLGLEETSTSLAERVSANAVQGTVLIDITATAPSPVEAAAIVNAAAEVFLTVIPSLETPSGSDSSPVSVTIVSEGIPPTAPTSPNIALNMALGVLAGLAVGVGLAILRDQLDRRVHSESDLARLSDAAVLGSVHADLDAGVHVVVDSGARRWEDYRRLRANLQYVDVDSRPRSIVVTSAIPNEGKSTTILNLAVSLADAGESVILVDADLRRPSVAQYLGLEGGAGLTSILIGRADLDDVIQPWRADGIDVLASGPVPPNPGELLGSRAMAAVIAELTTMYDHVLIDTAPLLPVVDAAVLARMVDGAVVVVGSGSTQREQVDEALASLAKVDARVLGLVLNRVKRRQGREHSYYDYTSMPEQRAQRIVRNPLRTGRRRPVAVPAADAMEAADALEAVEAVDPASEPWTPAWEPIVRDRR